jgi:hypothetical protein
MSTTSMNKIRTMVGDLATFAAIALFLSIVVTTTAICGA